MEEKKISDNQIKGIDLSVKALRKIFPLIKGWEFTEGWEKYQAHTYINVYIDCSELSKLFDLEISDTFKLRLERDKLVHSHAILAPFDWGSYGTEEFEKMGDLSFEFGRKLNKTLYQAYEYIPEEMKIYWKSSNGFKYETKILIDGYFFRF